MYKTCKSLSQDSLLFATVEVLWTKAPSLQTSTDSSIVAELGRGWIPLASL